MLRDRISILAVSPHDEDHRSLQEILRRSNWALYAARTIAEALGLLQSNEVSVILCERDLPDGTWKDLLKAVAARAFPPRLIVASTAADEYLWSAVLNLGGFDVLIKPFQPPELFRVASHADRSWRDQARVVPERSLISLAAR